jgi:hypothetical protein
MALVEIHGRPIGYSSSKTAVERSMWIGHRVRHLATVRSFDAPPPGESVRAPGDFVEHNAPHYEAIHGVEHVVWPVMTCCGKRIEVILEADYGFAEARLCELCERTKRDADLLLVEIMPPVRRGAGAQSLDLVSTTQLARKRREMGVMARDAF